MLEAKHGTGAKEERGYADQPLETLKMKGEGAGYSLRPRQAPQLLLRVRSAKKTRPCHIRSRQGGGGRGKEEGRSVEVDGGGGSMLTGQPSRKNRTNQN